MLVLLAALITLAPLTMTQAMTPEYAMGVTAELHVPEFLPQASEEFAAAMLLDAQPCNGNARGNLAFVAA
jgi:hypothetical protein